MSKERELLQRCLDEFEYKGVACNELCIDINKLLAQPEPLTPRQGLEEYKKGYAQAELDLKREPLTPQQISVGNQSTLNVTREAFKQGVKFAEKMHGIGEGDE